jgi:hypothetical protein
MKTKPKSLSEWYERYVSFGFKALKCKGYHSRFNPKKVYKIAKEPITKGFTKASYQSLTHDECAAWTKTDGWIGWLIPEGIIALDIEDEASIDFIFDKCKQLNITPPGIHDTDNGHHMFFQCENHVPASSMITTKAGPEVTPRVGGKNYLILAPTNDRSWQKWVLYDELPQLPAEFLPYDQRNKGDVVRALSWSLGDALKSGLLQGFDDIDTSYMAYLIAQGFDEGEIMEAFKLVFRNDYSQKQTKQMYKRAKARLDNGKTIRGAGTFLKKLKDTKLEKPLSFTDQLSSPEVNTATEEWQKPIPLPDELAPVDSFDFDLLPDSLQPWAKDICDRIQCPPDYVAAGIMTGLAAVLGRKVAVRPKEHDDWTVIPNVWTLIVGRPGVLKSPALEATLAPLKRLVAQAVENHILKYAEYNMEKELAAMRSDAKKKEVKEKLKEDSNADVLALLTVGEPDVPTQKRYIANDTTPASLGELLRLNPNGLLVHRDELVSLLKNLDREDMAEGRGFYLTAWNGDSAYTFDRIGRGLNLHIDAVCLSLLGGTQPSRLAEYIGHAVRGGTGDDGLIQRFGLLVWPDTNGSWHDVDREPDRDAKHEAFKVFEHLDTLSPSAIRAREDMGLDGKPDGPPYLRLTSGALKVFQKWRVDLEKRLRVGDLHPAIESHFAKYRKLIPALALIIHLANFGRGPVTKKAMLKAVKWGKYLESHALRAYGAITHPEVVAAKAILARIRKGDLRAPLAPCRPAIANAPGWV